MRQRSAPGDANVTAAISVPAIRRTPRAKHQRADVRPRRGARRADLVDDDARRRHRDFHRLANRRARREQHLALRLIHAARAVVVFVTRDRDGDSADGLRLADFHRAIAECEQRWAVHSALAQQPGDDFAL